MTADGADQTDQDFLDSLERRHPRAIAGAPAHVRPLRPAEPRAPEEAAAKGEVDIASGHFFGDADATSCATFLIPMETACCHERTSLQHGRGLVPPERTISSRVAPAVNSACQRFSK